jgi:hypothetical protein
VPENIRLRVSVLAANPTPVSLRDSGQILRGFGACRLVHEKHPFPDTRDGKLRASHEGEIAEIPARNAAAFPLRPAMLQGRVFR